MSLDGDYPLNYSAYKPFYRPEQILFQASNLAAGEHSITVRSGTGTNSTVYFAIDYAQVFMPSSGDSRYAQCYFGVATVIKTLQKRFICCPNCWDCCGLCLWAFTSRGCDSPFSIETWKIFPAQKETRGFGP